MLLELKRERNERSGGRDKGGRSLKTNVLVGLTGVLGASLRLAPVLFRGLTPTVHMANNSVSK